MAGEGRDGGGGLFWLRVDCVLCSVAGAVDGAVAGEGRANARGSDKLTAYGGRPWRLEPRWKAMLCYTSLVRIFMHYLLLYVCTSQGLPRTFAAVV